MPTLTQKQWNIQCSSSASSLAFFLSHLGGHSQPPSAQALLYFLIPAHSMSFLIKLLNLILDFFQFPSRRSHLTLHMLLLFGPVPSSFRAFSPSFATSIVSCTLCCFESLEKNTFQLHIYTSLCLLFLDYRCWSYLHSI